MVALSKFFKRINLDVVGFSASSLCAIHCLIFPVLVVAGNLSMATTAHNHIFENIILVVSAIVGGSSLLPAYYSHHGSLRPLMLFVAGMLVIISGRLTSELVYHAMITTFGAALVAWSHLYNWRMSHAGHPATSKADEAGTSDAV